MPPSSCEHSLQFHFRHLLQFQTIFHQKIISRTVLPLAVVEPNHIVTHIALQIKRMHTRAMPPPPHRRATAPPPSAPPPPPTSPPCRFPAVAVAAAQTLGRIGHAASLACFSSLRLPSVSQGWKTGGGGVLGWRWTRMQTAPTRLGNEEAAQLDELCGWKATARMGEEERVGSNSKN